MLSYHPTSSVSNHEDVPVLLPRPLPLHGLQGAPRAPCLQLDHQRHRELLYILHHLLCDAGDLGNAMQRALNHQLVMDLRQ
eukprot:1186248-Prorocentrum_minimum.AAC.4